METQAYFDNIREVIRAEICKAQSENIRGGAVVYGKQIVVSLFYENPRGKIQYYQEGESN